MIMSLSLKYLGRLSLAVILGALCGCWSRGYQLHAPIEEGPRSSVTASARAGPVDREGRFEFRHVPAGAYYLTCNVHYRRSMFRIGRFNFGPRTLANVETYANVSVEPEQKVDIKVTRPPA